MTVQLEHRVKEPPGPMEAEHRYRAVAWWTAGQAGLTKSEAAPNALHFAAPPEFGGLEGRWTPESLLLSAVASCFTTTFDALARNSRFEYVDLEVVAEGSIHKSEKGYSFADIVIRPKLTVPNEEERQRGLVLLNKTKAICMVSRALAAPPVCEPCIQVAGAPH